MWDDFPKSMSNMFIDFVKLCNDDMSKVPFKFRRQASNVHMK